MIMHIFQPSFTLFISFFIMGTTILIIFNYIHFSMKKTSVKCFKLIFFILIIISGILYLLNSFLQPNFLTDFYNDFELFTLNFLMLLSLVLTIYLYFRILDGILKYNAVVPDREFDNTNVANVEIATDLKETNENLHEFDRLNDFDMTLFNEEKSSYSKKEALDALRRWIDNTVKKEKQEKQEKQDSPEKLHNQMI